MSSERLMASLKNAKASSRAMARLTHAQRKKALLEFSRILVAESGYWMRRNERDLRREKRGLSPSLYARLKLDQAKILDLAGGLRELAGLPDPVGLVLFRRRLAPGLILEKKTVPLGVLAIVVESRPDAFPQILGLALKSGNAVVLKGGSEARESQRALARMLGLLRRSCPYLPRSWVTLLETRDAVRGLLQHPEYIDLVIPRGSNALVSHVKKVSKIPVLGHAEGVCHLYVDRDRKSTRLNSSHIQKSRMPSSA